jgi:hypothetical protein
VELYLPWNDTWIDLPPLPDLTFDGNKFKMSDTNIMSLRLTEDKNILYLLGGSNMDMSRFDERTTSKVWVLEFIMDNHTYCWSQNDPELGKYDICLHNQN